MDLGAVREALVGGFGQPSPVSASQRQLQVRELRERDHIAPIAAPRYSRGRDAQWPDDTAVLGWRNKCYPVPLMEQHEVVQERVGRRPVSVTFCPLTHTGVVYYGHWGTSGLLYNNNLVLYRASNGQALLLPQILGQVITAPAEGERVEREPIVLTTLARWLRHRPDSLVLSNGAPAARASLYGDYQRSPEIRFPLSDQTWRAEAPAKLLVQGALLGASQTLPLAFGLEAEPESFQFALGGARYLAEWDELLQYYFLRELPSGRPVFSLPAFWFGWASTYPHTRIATLPGQRRRRPGAARAVG